MKRSVHVAFFISLLNAAAAPGEAVAQDGLSDCVTAAMFGPEKKFVKIFGHEFHCKPLNRTPLASGGVQYAGQLSHQLSLRPDDQRFYEFVVKDGTLVKDSVKTKTKDGGFDPIVGLAGSAIGAYFGVPVSAKDVASVWDSLAKNVTGRGWSEAADLVVASVALQMVAIASLPEGKRIVHRATGRYVDAYQSSEKDFGAVLRPNQGNDSQRWVLTPLGNNTFRIQQKSTGRYLDAHTSEEKDYTLVTRQFQDNNSQMWMVLPLGKDTFTIQQKSSGRFVDSHDTADKDFRMVSRPKQSNTTQHWILQ